MSEPKTGLAKLARIAAQIREGTAGPFGRPARTLLLAASKLYALGSRIRNLSFDRGLRPMRSAGVRVISVGNLTTGGTGKTPFVLLLAESAVRAGYHPAILTRGYRRASQRDRANVDGGDAGADDEGDEVKLYRHILPAVPVVVDADRAAGAAAAVEGGADLLILDDGFQHRRLLRDVDIVLVDAREPFGGEHVLPLGLLREPTTGLRRASLVIVTRSDRVDPQRLDELRHTIRRIAPTVPIVVGVHEPTGLRAPRRDEDGVEGERLDRLRGRRVVTFSGIADPTALAESVVSLGGEVLRSFDFGDHHEFSETELDELTAEAARLDAEWIVTTDKDEMRLGAWERAVPLRILQIEARLQDPVDLKRLGQIVGFTIRDRK